MGQRLTYSRERVTGAVTDAYVDREARKGPPIPSDHAPVVIDLDTPGTPFDAGWVGAMSRVAARTKPAPGG